MSPVPAGAGPGRHPPAQPQCSPLTPIRSEPAAVPLLVVAPGSTSALGPPKRNSGISFTSRTRAARAGLLGGPGDRAGGGQARQPPHRALLGQMSGTRMLSLLWLGPALGRALPRDASSWDVPSVTSQCSSRCHSSSSSHSSAENRTATSSNVTGACGYATGGSQTSSCQGGRAGNVYSQSHTEQQREPRWAWGVQAW